MALTRRLRVNNVLGVLGANYIAGSLQINLGAALPAAAVPDVSGTQFLPVVVNPDTGSENIVYITGPAISGSLYPCVGGQEGTTDIGASTSDPWLHGPTVTDFVGGATRVLGPFTVTHATSGIATGVALFTPHVGDVILDAFIVIHTPFAVTTPVGLDGYLDLGTFLDAGDSWFTLWGSSGANGVLGPFDSVDVGTDLSGSANNVDMSITANAMASSDFFRPQLVVVNAVPFCARITGTLTAGDADIYVVLATPAIAY